MRNITRILCIAGLIAVIAVGAVNADDRDLLRTVSAPPNVLLILDSGASMTHNGRTNSMTFLANGDDEGGHYTEKMVEWYTTNYTPDQLRYSPTELEDDHGYPEEYAAKGLALGPDYLNLLEEEFDRGSKLPQAKRALTSLMNAGFQFNWGFSYYKKTNISIGYLNFIYRVKEYVDSDDDGVEDDPQLPMLNGSTVGTPMRFGASYQNRGNTDPEPFFPVRYGVNGDEGFLESSDPFGNNTGSPDSPVAGDKRLVSFLVNGSDPFAAGFWPLASLSLADRKNGHDFYHPAYDMDGVAALGSWIDNGLDGSKTWEDVAQKLSPPADLSDIDGKIAFRDRVVAAIEAEQIGSTTLYIAEGYQVYTAAGTWERAAIPPGQITEVEYVNHFVLYDQPWTDDPPTGDTLSSLNYQGTADCGRPGYLSDEGGDVPIVPINEPGDVTTEEFLDTLETQKDWIKTFFEPQTTPIFYFPGELVQFLPAVRENYIPMTETVAAIGRRPIKDSLTGAEGYFKDEVADFNDSLSQCRRNFVIIITDGVETCSNLNAPCSSADNLYKNTEGAFGEGTPGVSAYVVYFGGEDDALKPDLTVVDCVAERSFGVPFHASDEDALLAAFMAIGRDIEERTRGFSSPMVPSVEASTKQTAYVSTFTPLQERSIWRGHLRAYPINPVTGVVGNLTDRGTPSVFTALWDVGDVLAERWDWGDEFIDSVYGTSTDPRKIYYGKDVNGTPTRKSFSYPGHAGTDAAFEARQELRGLMWPDASDPPVTFADELDVERIDLRNVIDFMRGVRYGNLVENPDADNPPDPPLSLRNVLLDEFDQPIWSSSYQWCGPSGDDNTGDDTNAGSTCEGGLAVIGIEKLGDIFHSVPQRMSSPACFACYLSDYQNYRGFLANHRQRRTVMFAGSNDGVMHAFEAGLWDLDGDSNLDPPAEPQTDAGTGRELFAWVPASVMDRFPILTNGVDQEFTVDGTGTVADVFIDRVYSGNPVAADREWRTLLMWGQRRGGRSYVALDITQPDTYTEDFATGQFNTNRGGTVAFKTREVTEEQGDPPVTVVLYTWESLTTKDEVGNEIFPNSGRDAICADGTDGDCSGAWPAFRWEFTDTSDEEPSSGNPLAPYPGEGAPDLGFTWSRPLIAFVKVSDGDRMVAFFGGGYSAYGVNAANNRITGNWIYGLDMETGEILMKLKVDGMVPGGVQGLDIDLDGFLEKLFFATTEGNVYRIDFSTAGTIDATGRVNNWTAEKIFDADGYQPFFMRPALVPISFNNDGTANVAIAIGSGNRDDIFELNAAPHRFYVFNEPGSGTTVTDTDLEGLAIRSADQTENFLVSETVDGWYLEFYDSDDPNRWEKVNTNALVLNDFVIFSTFNPVEDITVTEEGTCERGGSARTYVVGLANANPQPGVEDRFEDLGSDTAMVSDPVVYLGADGKIHVIQATDNLELEEPIASFDAPVRMVNWKEE